MKGARIDSIQSMFASRLDTLAHLLRAGEEALGDGASLLERRIAPDMLPFGTQIAFTCNQPRNFALWSQGRPADNLDPAIKDVARARDCITQTKELLSAVTADDSKLAGITRLDLGPGLYAEMTGEAYVSDFLVPNFYFHLVTAYDILRMAGVPLGKRDYMQHLLPFVRQTGTTSA